MSLEVVVLKRVPSFHVTRKNVMDPAAREMEIVSDKNFLGTFPLDATLREVLAWVAKEEMGAGDAENFSIPDEALSAATCEGALTLYSVINRRREVRS